MPAKLNSYSLSTGTTAMKPKGKLARKALRLSLREGIRQREQPGKHVPNKTLFRPESSGE